jgi:hypothetical protein
VTAVRWTTRSRASFGWALLFFAAAQLLLAVAMERRVPQWRDREYGWKLARLRQRLARHPGRPLALMLGSSRTVYGFQAGCCDALRGPGGEPFVGFNFGVAAAGPLREYLCLQSLLDEGVRPGLLLVEVLPPLLNEPGPDRVCEENWLYVPSLAAADVLRLRPYDSRPGRLLRTWLRSRLVPWHAHRARLLEGWSRPWHSREEGAGPLARMDRSGWIAPEWERVGDEKRRRETERARRQYAGAFADFRLGGGPAQALRDLLARCRAEQIRVALVLMPEGTTFRGWYPPGMEAAVRHFLEQLQDGYGVAVIDARRWVDDEDFWDAHHLLPAGAAAFSRRLVREVGHALKERAAAAPTSMPTCRDTR